jgi:hypothetical protein
VDWKKKTEKLRLLILSNEIDQPLPDMAAEMFDAQRRFRKGEIDVESLQRTFETVGTSAPHRFIWEPFSDLVGDPQTIYGWTINVAMYQRDNQNWWLVRVERRPTNALLAKDKKMLGKILEVLGGHIEHDALSISTLEDCVQEGVPFMWTWINQAPLYETQLNATTKVLRIVPRGTIEADGFVRMPVIRADPPN